MLNLASAISNSGFGRATVAPPAAPAATRLTGPQSVSELNLDRILADLRQAQSFQAAVWKTFGKKVKERDDLAAAPVINYAAIDKANSDLAMIERDMMRAAELVCRLGALYYVFENGGVQALRRVTLNWEASDSNEKPDTLSITLG
jgi:hypothetical protein